jgi:hypothetical protein
MSKRERIAYQDLTDRQVRAALARLIDKDSSVAQDIEVAFDEELGEAIQRLEALGVESVEATVPVSVRSNAISKVQEVRPAAARRHPKSAGSRANRSTTNAKAGGTGAAIESAVNGNGRAASGAAAVSAAPKARKRPNAKELASRKIQGRYLGLIRQVPGGKRKQFKAIVGTDGREAAIKALEAYLGK